MIVGVLWFLLACETDKSTADDSADDSGTPEITDRDGDGTDDVEDCLPDDASSYPGADERCDGADNDCDGSIDEDAFDEQVWYTDADGDGFGDDTLPRSACDGTANESLTGGDCDDTDAAVHPGAAESCNGADDDCDTDIDEDFTYPIQTWYEDTDGDGYGEEDGSTTGCEQPAGYAANLGDCDDDDPLYWDSCPEPLGVPAYTTDCDVDAGYRLSLWTSETPAEPELHLFGVYEALTDATVYVHIGRATQQTLVLSAYAATHWIVSVDEGVALTEVVLNGYEAQTGEVPDGVVLSNRSPYDVWLKKYAYTYPSTDADALIRAAEAYAGTDATSFAGCYQVSNVRLD